VELCTAAPSPAAVNEVQAIDHDSKTGDSRHDADPIDRSTGCRQAEEKPGRDDDTGSPRPRNRARESCLMSLPSRSPPNVFCSLSLSLSPNEQRYLANGPQTAGPPSCQRVVRRGLDPC
jgi:hypothetical protein